VKIYITGGGESENYRDLDKHFLANFGKNNNLLLLPMANDQEDFEDCLERIEATYQDLGHKGAVELLEDLTQFSLNQLANYPAIYIDGGNTFTLIEQIRNNSFIDCLKKYSQNGGIIHADSAGGIILGAHVKTAFIGEDSDDNQEKTQNFSGTGLLKDWAIHCHYDPHEDELLQDIVYESGLPILALSEYTGVYIEDHELSVFGQQDLSVLNMMGKKLIPVGTKIALDLLLE